MKYNAINWDATSVAMRQFGVFYHFQFMNVILQLFIWQYILKMGSECILQRKTTLTAFFSLCRGDLFAKTLRYSDVPKYYTWNAPEKKFQRRKQGKPVEGHPNIYSSDALGRLYTVHPSNQECFYLRLLLVNVCGPESFQELRTVNGKVCSTYREACQELYLLENDAHWDTTLADASSTAQPHQIRMLFAILLTTCFPSKPMDLWEKYKDSMSEDILHHLRAANLDFQFTPEIYNRALVLFEDICLAIANKKLGQMGLCAPNRSANDSYDRDLQREAHFDVDDLSVFVERNLSKLVPEQRIAYDTLMQAISDQRGGLYFLDAPGGTGKTFLINLILATIRSRNEIAVAIASSGIAATLLDGGRAAHSALKLPLNLHTIETPTCNISKNSGMGKVLQTCKLIIWDECTMAHKKGLEALDRTLKDLRANGNSFCGALILLSGDFRQTLPVIPRLTPADELNACLKSSVLWPQWLSETNFSVQNWVPGEERTYTSIHTVLNEDEAVNYPTYFLNCLDLPGFPPHVLQLKTGVPIILLRNINPPKLCNGTRLSVKTMMNNIIEATILNGKFKGQDVLLTRIPLFPPDLPFEFKRLQFHVRTAFSMNINKAQGQSLKVCGLNLEVPCFSHGQLYVASSRVGNPSNLYVYTPDKTGTYTCNSSNGLFRYLHQQQFQWFIQVPTPAAVPMVYSGTYTCNSSNGLFRYLHLQQFQWFIQVPTPATVPMVYAGTYTCNSSNGLFRYLHLQQFQWFMQVPTPATVPMVYSGTYTCNSSNGLFRYLHLQQFQWFIQVPTPATVPMVYAVRDVLYAHGGLYHVQIALCSFATYVMISEFHVLDASKAFVSLTLFNMLRFSIIIIPDLVSYFVQIQVSFKRIDDFLNCEELDENIVGDRPRPDNGRQFVSGEFEQFTKMNGIRHTKTSPYNPNTNVLAERYVREFENLLRKNNGKDDLETNLQSFLFAHRAFSQTVIKEFPGGTANEEKFKIKILEFNTLMRNPREVFHEAVRRQEQFTTGCEVYFHNYATGPKR
ncbi:hypothetical protein LAZ67_10002721 [Cordylochernes scorpioides]|uniref:ATP-dependent DNA helicase n=1 Tax=Cordylochernes scorpioides TaxID=51811 RepID=A0ABY6KXH2_9ARAC|nr:hypothetical protein LAZ67_10002721 [Cordylochernes scorpioides]